MGMKSIKILGLILSSYLSGILSGTILCEIFSTDNEIFKMGFLVGFFVPILVLISNYILTKER